MGKRTPTWKLYEQQIFESLRTKATDAGVSANAQLPGRHSGVDRQIDVLLTGRFPGLDHPQIMVVECKAFTRRVHVKDVETAFGLVDDVGAPFGLLITTVGFTEAAKRRAGSFRGLSLDVVALVDLAVWLPRRPTIAWTEGTNTATLTWWDRHGVVRTDLVPFELAKRLSQARH
jgi:hypothetical protein